MRCQPVRIDACINLPFAILQLKYSLDAQSRKLRDARLCERLDGMSTWRISTYGLGEFSITYLLRNSQGAQDSVSPLVTENIRLVLYVQFALPH